MTTNEQPLPSSYNSEGRIADLGSSLAVVVTHPWGPLGGDYHNNVVRAVVAFFQQAGITTIRFNFRGSQIGFGSTQVNQVVEVCQQVLKGEGCTASGVAPKKLLLVGYSYGSLIATSASADLADSVIATISVAPPFGVQHWLLFFQSSYHTRRAAAVSAMPRLFVMGDHDNFTDVKTFQGAVERDFAATTNKESIIVKSADHFFARREDAIIEVVGKWLLSTTQVESLRLLARHYD